MKSCDVWCHQTCPPVCPLLWTQSFLYADVPTEKESVRVLDILPNTDDEWCHHPVCARSLFRVMSPRLKWHQWRWKTLFVLWYQWKFGANPVDRFTSRLFPAIGSSIEVSRRSLWSLLVLLPLSTATATLKVLRIIFFLVLFANICYSDAFARGEKKELFSFFYFCTCFSGLTNKQQNKFKYTFELTLTSDEESDWKPPRYSSPFFKLCSVGKTPRESQVMAEKGGISVCRKGRVRRMCVHSTCAWHMADNSVIRALLGRYGAGTCLSMWQFTHNCPNTETHTQLCREQISNGRNLFTRFRMPEELKPNVPIQPIN